MAFVKRLDRRVGLTHRIRVGDGLVLLVSDPGANLARGTEIVVKLEDLDQAQIKLVVDAPREAATIYIDAENPDAPRHLEG